MEEKESQETKEAETPQTSPKENDAALDAKIEKIADEKLGAWQKDLETRELKLQLQEQKLHKLADEVRRGGTGIAVPQEKKEKSNVEYADDLITGKMNVKATIKNS